MRGVWWTCWTTQTDRPAAAAAVRAPATAVDLPVAAAGCALCGLACHFLRPRCHAVSLARKTPLLPVTRRGMHCCRVAQVREGRRGQGRPVAE